MKAGANEKVYWVDCSDPKGFIGEAPVLDVEKIANVVPLDIQFGVSNPLTVPEALRDILFGQLEAIAGQVILPVHTYAILDAAKVPCLPELHEASGCDDTCLFKGGAATELRDVAPGWSD